MKRFTASLIVFVLLLVSIPQKSEAVVGIVIKDRTTRTIGGIVTAVSGVSFATSLVLLSGSTYITGTGVLFFFGFAGIPIGLVILDEKNADLKFQELSGEKAKLLGLSNEELEIYNSEVEELNLVKSEIEAQISEKASDEEVASLWSEYGKTLSPETLNVASKVIVKTFSK
jgi:hypothetical protein